MQDYTLHSVCDCQARLGGISRKTFYELVKKNSFPIRKLGSRTVVRSDDLQAYIKSLDPVQNAGTN